MSRIATWLTLAAWLVSAAAGAERAPATGQLLVATEQVRGDFFARTVVLLLHYDDTGALGLVVNRPTDVAPDELLTDVDGLSDYRGTLYWGGPVQMASVRALLRTDEPPEGAVKIVDRVHLVFFEDAVPGDATDSASLRFFIGYAGWAPGQLDRELALGSWHIVPASDELVFAEEPGSIWKQLTPVDSVVVLLAGH